MCQDVCVCACACVLSHVWLFETLRTTAQQAPLSMKFSRQEYWSGLPLPTPENLPDPGVKLVSLASPALQVNSFITTPPCKPGIFVTSWAVAHQAPLSMEFPRQEYWSELPFLLKGDFPNPRIKPTSPASPTLQADCILCLWATGKPWLLSITDGSKTINLAEWTTYRTLQSHIQNRSALG